MTPPQGGEFSKEERSMQSKYAGKIFDFSRRRLGFVDLEKLDINNKVIKGKSEAGTEGAFIWDKKFKFEDKDDYQEFPLNETAAFIMRFLVLQVPADLIAKIYESEYGGGLTAAEETVDGFIDALKGKGLLAEATKAHKEAAPPEASLLNPKKFLGFDIPTKVGINQTNYYRILHRI
jgi:hypothetical protein